MTNEPFVLSLYILDLGSNSAQKIGSFENLWLWHVDVDGNLLVTFEIDWDTNPLEVKQCKWTLTDQLLESKYLSLSLSGHRIAGGSLEPIFGIENHRMYRCRTMRCESCDEHHLLDLIYDHPPWTSRASSGMRGVGANTTDRLALSSRLTYSIMWTTIAFGPPR